ncbi:MAG TPA: MoaD/ThiS family protein [Bacteroidales bacterium]|nr:MoaD/ThiS family protein [Bacteroidales bacterium]
MTITVLFFGALSEVAGTGTKFYNDVGSLDELSLRIADDYPLMVHYSYRISVNNEITGENAVLKDGDEVAFLPPFAGG